MKNVFLHGLTVAVLTCLPALAQAQAPTPAQAPLTLQSPMPIAANVKIGKLENGLTYYIQHNPQPARRAELRLIVKAGSILEDDDQLGLAHFVEHMAFNGSKHFKKNELVSYLQSMGVRFGADLNARTGFDDTVYFLPIPLDRPANLTVGFQVLEDWAHGVTFDPDMVEKERPIVQEELRMYKGFQDRIRKQAMPHLFNGSRYADRLPIGTEESLRTFKPEALRRFYQDWYRPDLMAVVVVGDINPTDAEALVHKHFAHLRNRANARVREYPVIAATPASSAVVVTDPEAPMRMVSLRYPVQPVGESGTVGAYREGVIRQLFLDMLNQRLATAPGRERSPWLSVTASLEKVAPKYQAYEVSATIPERGARPALAALVEEHKRVRQHGFTIREVALAAKAMVSKQEHAYLERDRIASATFANEYTEHFLIGAPISGIDFKLRLLRGLLPSLSLDEINAYAKRLIPSDAQMLVVYAGAPGADVPSEKVLLDTASAAARRRVTGFDEATMVTTLLERTPRAGKIVSEEADQQLGLTRLTLSNGVKVILKPTTWRNDEVLLSAVRLGGLSQADERDILNARLAGRFVADAGVGLFTGRDTRLALAGKKATVTPKLTSYSEELDANAGADDVETMLQMVWLHFQDMVALEGVVLRSTRITKEMIRQEQALPEYQFDEALTTALYNHHPRTPREVRNEDLQSGNLARSAQFFRNRFSSAKDMTFIVVGNIDMDAIRPMLATYLGSLPTRDIEATVRDVAPRTARGVVKREIKAGSEPKSTVALVFAGAADYSVADAMRVRALREILQLRITSVLREKIQLIYSGSASGNVRAYPYGQYDVTVKLPTGPENVDRALAATFAEIEQLRTQGPSADELEKVRTVWLLEHKRAQTQNSYWVRHLRAGALSTSSPPAHLDYEKQLKTLTTADIQAAAVRYLDPANYVQVVLNPAAGGAMSDVVAHRAEQSN